MVGQYIGRYRVVRQLGAGGMGVVYEAVDEEIERRAAIKVLHPKFSEDRAVARRFFNEARAANIIQHPGIVSVSELGHLPSGSAYIVMEFLQGESLGERLSRRMSHEEVGRLGRQIASALQAAHEKHIVHRDLKPDNVMLVRDPEVVGGERAKILDFGIAKLTQDHSSPDGVSMHTSAGIAMGTPVYMAPEQCQGAAGVTDRADVYALGVMLYQMLSGKLPHTAASPMAWMIAHVSETPRPLREADPSVPEDLAQLVHAMLAKDPAARPAMGEVAERLDRLGQRATPPAAPAVLVSQPAQPEVPGPVLSTLGQAAAQSRISPRRPPRLGMAAALGAVLLGCLALVAVRPGHRQKLPEVVPAVAPAPSAPVVPAVPAAQEVQRPAKVNVRWAVTTEPAGAEVVRQPDGEVLGMTPWRHEQPAGSGAQRLLLRRKAYVDASIELDQGRDEERHERLKPQAREPRAEPRRRGDDITNDQIRFVD